MSKIVVCFEYTHFDHKCRDVPNHKLILTLHVNSLDTCVEQCLVRQNCFSLIYKRLFPLCELYSVDISELKSTTLGTSCIVIRRKDINLNGTEVLKSNQLLHVYMYIPNQTRKDLIDIGFLISKLQKMEFCSCARGRQ